MKRSNDEVRIMPDIQSGIKGTHVSIMAHHAWMEHCLTYLFNPAHGLDIPHKDIIIVILPVTTLHWP